MTFADPMEEQEQQQVLDGQQAPGWYTHPDRTDEEWYWDGSAWTESHWKEGTAAPAHTQAEAAAPAKLRGPDTGWVVAGYVFLLFFPLVSLFIALGVLRPRGNPQWRWITLVFGVQFVAFIALIVVGSVA